MYIEYNPNPLSRRVGDCAVRALTKALDLDWEQTYALLCANGALMGDMPSADAVVECAVIVMATQWRVLRNLLRARQMSRRRMNLVELWENLSKKKGRRKSPFLFSFFLDFLLKYSSSE